MDGMQWKIWLREHSREVLETIGLSREDRILDFGCGMGHYTFPAARLGGLCILTDSTIKSNLMRPLILKSSDHRVMPSCVAVRVSQ